MGNNSSYDIVLLGTAFPFRGGLANYNHRLAEAYQAQGFKVKIITFSLQYPSILFPGKTQFSDEPKPENLDIDIALNSMNPFSWIRVGRKIKALKPRLLIIKFWIPFMGPALGTVAKIARKNGLTKVISIIDNIIPHEKRPGDKMLAQYFANQVDGFIAMSKSVLSDLKLFAKTKKCLFTPHPIYDNFGSPMDKNIAKKKLNLEEDVHYLLFFGFIRDYKGLDLLLEAMAEDRIKKSKIKLIIAGEFYTDSKPYMDLIAKLGIDNQLIMATDFIPDSQVGLYFNACDLVVQPYKEATQSGVTQIAYSFEKPMVVTDVGGLSEIVPHHKAGYVVDVDPHSIADAILDFYEQNRSEAMVEFCKQEKLKYSWETMIQKIEELI